MKAIPITKTVLHVSNVACLMNCSSSKVYNLIRAGNLDAYKVGKAWLITVDALNNYLHVESHR
ncbi:helix-turn-helix domain-containing protein [Megasphaera sueciensis]|uniref:helix-turn-helix domain-containing protein n=1 Tax=Megasphaera sueciensis TaxID=349094 RepID=UPI003D06CDF9